MMLAFDPASNPLNNNEWSFPLAECIHIATFAMAIGTIATVDLCMMGLGFRKQTPAQLLKETSLWTLAGLIITISAGLVIFSTDPVRYYYNWSFRYKVIALVLAIVYNYTIHRKVAVSDSPPVVRKMAALVSLALWVSIVFSGIFYAFT
ncbi:MAG TPA: DUF6644 family protein [Bryobacteraceae bacterium]|nr:DUF6644 family protein [Bryobacteraceae bacterium]